MVSEATNCLTSRRSIDGVVVEPVDGVLDERPAALRADDQAGADLAQLDHVGHVAACR